MTIEELIEELERHTADVIIVSEDEKTTMKAIKDNKNGLKMILWSIDKQ